MNNKGYVLRIDGYIGEYCETFDDVLLKIKDLDNVTQFEVIKIIER